MSRLARFLERYGACEDALGWIFENQITAPTDAWAACEHPDWLAWVVDRLHLKATMEQRDALQTAYQDYEGAVDSAYQACADVRRAAASMYYSEPEFGHDGFNHTRRAALEAAQKAADTAYVLAEHAARVALCDAYRIAYACPVLPEDPDHGALIGPDDDDLPF